MATINGSSGNDNLNGTSGDDEITAGSGNDTASGGSGDDTFHGGAGYDDYYGGNDADYFSVTNNDGNDYLYGGEGGDDRDKVGFINEFGFSNSVQVIFTGSEIGDYTFGSSDGSFWEIEEFDGTDYADTFDMRSSSSSQTVNSGGGADTVLGGSGNDTIDSGGGNDSLDGGAGNDSIEYGNGDDTVYGGSGDDVIDDDSSATSGDNQLYGEAGNDTIHGSTGNDTISGGDDDDWIDGAAGNDVISGDAGDDTIAGGSGDDVIYGDSADTTLDVSINSSNFATSGNGYTVTAQNVSGGSLTSESTSNVTTFDGGFGASGTISHSDSGVQAQTGYDKASGLSERLIVRFDNDTDTASFSFKHLYTAGSAEQAHWAVYNDGALVAEGDFTEVGAGSGSGTIDISGYGDFDELVFTGLLQSDGTDGSDFMVTDITFAAPATATTGNDSISGGDGQDTIFGGAGADTISGGADADSLDGGDGADKFLIEDGFGDDTVDGGAGADTIDLSGLYGPVTVTYSGEESGTITDGTDTITFSEIEDIEDTAYDDYFDLSARTDDNSYISLTNGGDDTIIGGSGQDDLRAGDGNDSIVGGSGGGNLEGGAGDDTVIGGSGSEDIYGNTGDDSLSGLGGDDWFSGGAGSDTIKAGSGDDYVGGGNDADVFIIEDNFGNDTIDGGGGGTDDDSIDLSSLTGPATVTYTGDEAGTVTDGSDVVTFSDVENIFLSAFDDSVDGSADSVGLNIFAGDGDDTIAGGTGDDTISGEGGDDTFVYSAGDGDDTITDFNTGNTGSISDGDSSNNDFIDLSGYYDNLSELQADQSDDGVLNQSNATDAKGRSTDYSDNTQFGTGSLTMQGASSSSYSTDNTGVVCFTSGTLIRTPRGQVRIEDLQVGDLVTTHDNGPQRIRWIGTRVLNTAALRAAPRLRPILIPCGVLGATRDVLVSPLHGVLAGKAGDELVRAKHLLNVAGSRIRIAHGQRRVAYIHILFDRHEIVFANGVASESFYPGQYGLSTLSNAASTELLEIFPELSRRLLGEHDANPYGQTARVFAKSRTVKSRSACELALCVGGGSTLSVTQTPRSGPAHGSGNVSSRSNSMGCVSAIPARSAKSCSPSRHMIQHCGDVEFS